MRRVSLLLTVLSLCSFVFVSRGNAEPLIADNLARVSFKNLSTENVYLRLRRGNTEHNIGTLNLDENGKLRRTTSLIQSGQSREYIIPANKYTIILKKDENGRTDAGGNSYEEFFFPPSQTAYEINLFPEHRRTTSVAITSPDSAAGNKGLSLNPFFDIRFTEDMIQPIVESNIELIDETGIPIPVQLKWENKRHLTMKPLEPLRPSSTYTVIVELEARDIETDRIRETGEEPFRTGDTIEEVGPFDTSVITYDVSDSGMIRLEWNLPRGAIGSEIRIRRINNGETTDEIIDLQAKTSYSFSAEELRTIEFKIVPYRLINGRKAYNPATLNAPFRPIPRTALYGITPTVTANTAERLSISFSFKQRPPNDFEMILNGKGERVALNARNSFLYNARNPPMIPDEKIGFNLTVEGYDGDYRFTVQRPGDAEFYAAFEQKTLAAMNAIAKKFLDYYEQQYPADSLARRTEIISGLYREYTTYVYPAAHNIDDYKKRVKNNDIFMGIEDLYSELNNKIANDNKAARKTQTAAAAREKRQDFWNKAIGDKGRYWSLGCSIGTSFAAPWTIATVQGTFSPIQYTFIELGCDAGAFTGDPDMQFTDYWSLYPFGHFAFFVPFNTQGGFWLGAGGGYMMGNYHFAEEEEMTADTAINIGAFDITTGFLIGNIFTISYTLRTDFKTANNKVSAGFVYRLR